MFRRPTAALLALVLAMPLAQAANPAAMIYGTDAVSVPDAVSLPTSNDYWFTQGNGTSVNGTQVPSYWVNKVGGEIDAAIETGCSQTLNMSVRNQLSTCLSALHGRYLGSTIFTSPGTFTPAAGTAFVEVEIIGGGGGGGGAAATDSGHISAGSGGAAGSYAKIVALSGFAGVYVTPGAGGAGGAAGSAGGGGGTSYFGNLVNCSGASSAGSVSAPTGFIGQVGQGIGGAGCVFGAVGVIVTSIGQPGLNGLLLGTSIESGQGAPSVFGGGATNTNGGNGGTSTTPGAGGSGAGCAASCAGYSGGNGGPGIVIVRQYS